MSKTLSPNVSDGKDGGSPVYLMQITLQGSSSPDYYWASRAFTTGSPESQAYEDKFSIKGIGRTKQSIDLVQGGGIGEVGGLTFKLQNPGATFLSDSLFTSSLDWGNAYVELRLIFSPNPSSATWANAVPIAAGYVKSHPFDVSEIIFNCIDSWNKRHRKIGKLLSEELFEDIPDGNIGKIAPVIYGDLFGSFIHKTCIAFQNKGLGTEFGNPNDGAVILIVKPLTPGRSDGEIVVAGHDINDFGGLNYQLMSYDNDRAAYVRSVIKQGTSGGMSGGFYKRTGVGQFSSWKRYVDFYNLVPGFVSQVGTTTGENAVDENASNYTALRTGQSVIYSVPREEFNNLDGRTAGAISMYFHGTNADLGNDRLKIAYYKQDERHRLNYDNQIENFTVGQSIKGNSSGARAVIKADDDQGVTGTLTLRKISGEFKNNEIIEEFGAWPGLARVNGTLYASNEYGYHEAAELIGGISAADFVGDFEWDMTSDGYDEIYIKFEYETIDGADPDAEIRIWNIFLAGYACTQRPAALLARVKGREYGTWIDDADAARDSAYDEGDLIELPGAIVESILHDELDLTNEDDIDTDAFDQLEDDRVNWKFAREILDAEESLDVIDRLAYEGFFGYIQKYDGTETAFTFEPSGSPSSITLVVRWKENKPQITIKLSSLDEVRNRFFLHYKKNLVTDEFGKVLFVDHTDEKVWDSSYANLASEGKTYWDKCADVTGGAYKKYGLLKTWEYEAEWIRDDATAELFLKKMINWLTRQHWIVEMETFLDTIDLEIGDKRILTGPILPNHISGTTHFVLVGTQLNPGDSTIRLTWLDIGTP